MAESNDTAELTDIAYEGLVERIAWVTQTMFITHARQVPRTHLTKSKYAFLKKYYETESQRVKAMQDILAHDVIKYLMEHPI